MVSEESLSLGVGGFLVRRGRHWPGRRLPVEEREERPVAARRSVLSSKHYLTALTRESVKACPRHRYSALNLKRSMLNGPRVRHRRRGSRREDVLAATCPPLLLSLTVSNTVLNL